MNELHILRRLVASEPGGAALGTVTEIIAAGRALVQINTHAYRKAYGTASVGDRVLLRGDTIVRVMSQETEKNIFIM